jgi:hypothetical protein
VSNQTIGYETFLRLLRSRLNNQYTIDQLRSVIGAYMGERAGIGKYIRDRSEFREDYLGTWAYNEKGFENFGKMVVEGMLQKKKATLLSHALAKRKAWHEKRNKKVWSVRNMVEGHKFKDKLKQEFLKEKSKVKADQVLFHYKKRKVQLENEKKIK